MTSTKKNLKLQNFKCNYSLASTLKKNMYIQYWKKKEFLLLNFFKLSNSEKLKNEERKILFSHIYFCCHMVSRKKAKKNFHHHQKIYIPSNFLATLNSKIKKNEFSCPKKWNITTYSGKNITLKTANLISPK